LREKLVIRRARETGVRVPTDRDYGFSPMRGQRPGTTIRATRGGAMEILWTAITILFVAGTLATVAFATYRMFGGGHTHQH